MPNVIKPSQYRNVHHVITPIITNEKIEPSKQTKPNEDEDAVTAAFEKAKQIVDAANDYSAKHIKEATERMNEEAAKVKKESYDKAFSRGILDGKQEGSKLGFKEGYQKGYEEGLEKAKAEHKELLNALSLIVDSCENARKSLINREEENLSDLAMQIAETILQKQLKQDKKVMEPIIENLVDANHQKDWIKINVSKDVYDVLKEDNFEEKLKGMCSGVKLNHSRELGNTDCIVETPQEVIDASVTTQLNNIKSVLKK